MLEDHHGRLDLGVVVRVVGREQADRLSVARLEAGGRVGDALPREQRDDAGEEPDPEAARERRPVVARAGKPGADDDVRGAVEDRREQLRQLGGDVLAVAVEPDGEIEAFVAARP